MHDGMQYDPIQGQGQGHKAWCGGVCVDLWRLCEDGSRARLAVAEVTAVRAWAPAVSGRHGGAAWQTTQQPRETDPQVNEWTGGSWHCRYVMPLSAA